jgi:hypothetical protein
LKSTAFKDESFSENTTGMIYDAQGFGCDFYDFVSLLSSDEFEDYVNEVEEIVEAKDDEPPSKKVKLGFENYNADPLTIVE